MKSEFQIGRLGLAVIVALVVMVAASVVRHGAAAQKTTDPKAAATPPAKGPGDPPQEGAIPLPQIAARAEELMERLREMNDRLTADTTVSTMDEKLQYQDGLIREKQIGLHELIAITPTREELLDRELEWVAQKKLYADLGKILNERAKAVGEDVHFLDNQQSQWGAVLKQPKDAAAIAAVSERVKAVLAEIATTSKSASDSLKSLLTLQERASQQERVVVDALRSISQAKSRVQSKLWNPDSPPIWKAPLKRSDEPLDHLVSLSFKRNLVRTQEFLIASRNAGLGVVAIFLIALVGNIAIRRRIRTSNETVPAVRTLELFQRPVSMALLLVLLVLVPILPGVPVQVRSAIVALSLFPVLRLLAPIIKPVFRPFPYILVIFGVTAALWETAIPSPAIRRWGLAAWSLVAIAVVIWFTVRARRELRKSEAKTHRAITIIQFATVLFVLSMLANVFGFVALSRVFRSATVLSCYSVVVLYTGYLVVERLLSGLSGVRLAGFPSHVGVGGESIASWTLRILRWTAWYLWAYVTLNLFGIREFVVNFISAVLTKPIKVRAASFTPGDVLTFILVLLAGIAVASLVRVVLRDGILSRLNVKHGIPYAVSTISYYVLLLCVFLLAISAAGVELSKFTMLTGAIGIGVGFGLQNVIGNFVSGIILLFERPIRIGDFLEVGGSSGEVVRLGIRSSSIRTPQGAEVIVPNGDLISNPVVNWTLSEQKRSYSLQIKVAYGADPATVRELLLKTIRLHPDVVPDPEPLVFFLGFGDNSLDFELVFWVPDFTLRKKVGSEIAMRIAHEFREAGIDIPSPRRELRVTGTATSMKESVSVDESNANAAPEKRIESAASETKG